MSSIATSLHVSGVTQERVCTVLQGEKCRAYVFPSSERWTTFVSEDDSFGGAQRVARALHAAIMLRYCYAEDFYWGVDVFFEGSRRLEYLCDWSSAGEAVTISGLEWDWLITALGIEQKPELVRDLFSLLRPTSKADLFEREPYLKVPKLLGLEWFDGLSFEALDTDPTWALSQVQGLRKL